VTAHERQSGRSRSTGTTDHHPLTGRQRTDHGGDDTDGGDERFFIVAQAAANGPLPL
jgi:hypothetical protein